MEGNAACISLVTPSIRIDVSPSVDIWPLIELHKVGICAPGTELASLAYRLCVTRILMNDKDVFHVHIHGSSIGNPST